MAKLIYFMPTSLDGYIEDETGKLDSSAPDEEGFAFISDLLRPIGMYLYGRKMCETMAIWETPDVISGRTPTMLNVARVWRAADKIIIPNRSRLSLHRRRVSNSESTRRPSTWIICSSCLFSLAAVSRPCPPMYS